ncbi:PaaI family thioesterase [Hoeflea sp. TYP-13]|uniref:PaaI family thioesterase n=1 Tax=Hoeflea sp. TYP-13 TaxID=3230023 RepID=UPI0034C66428
MSNQLTVSDIQERISRSLYHQLFRPQVLEVDNERQSLVLKVHWRPEFERQPDTNQWHGGVIASLVDIAGCYALMLVAAGPMLTLNFSTDFLRLAGASDLTATAKVRRSGRTAGFVDVDICDDDGTLVAVGRACYAIRPPKNNV